MPSHRTLLTLVMVHLVIRLGCFTNSISVDFRRLQDGLLVTGKQGLRRQVAEWNTIVVLEAPQRLTKWGFLVNQVLDSLNSLEQGKILTNETMSAWKTRLRSLKINTYKRSKRGLFDFLGDISNKLFGTARQAEVDEIRQMILHTRSQQIDVVHFVDSLATVVNKTYAEVNANRLQINHVERAFTALETKLDRVMRLQLLARKDMEEVYTVLHLEQVCTALEAFQRHYYRVYDRYLRQRASLEIGRLTEELLPPTLLGAILSQGVEQKYHAVDLTWYYQFVEVNPVWGNSDTLVYSAKLPLVDDINYLHYLLRSWPTPYNSSGLSAQIEDIGDIGFDTEGGGMFQPHSCIGREPMICRTGPIFDLTRMQCPRGILTGDNKERTMCKVTIRRMLESQTRIDEVDLGEFVVVSWGEPYSVHCQGLGERRETLPPGVYYVMVPDICTVKGRGWTVSGITRKFVNTSLASEPLELPTSLDVQWTLPEDDVAKLLNAMLTEKHVTSDLKPMEQLAELRLEPLRLKDPDLFSQLDASHTLYINFAFVIVIIVTVCIAMYCCYIRCACIRNLVPHFPIKHSNDIHKDPREIKTVTDKDDEQSPTKVLTRCRYSEDDNIFIEEKVTVLNDP